MQPANLDLIEIQNADFRREFQKKDSDGNVVPITGSSFQLQLRSCPDSTVVVADWSTANGKIIIVDAANGIIRFNVTVADLLAISADVYFQDLVETMTGGIGFTWFSGQFTLKEAVTR